MYLQEGNYEESLNKFSTSMQNIGFKPYLAYNVALCYYRLKEYAPALKYCGKLVKYNIKSKKMCIIIFS